MNLDGWDELYDMFWYDNKIVTKWILKDECGEPWKYVCIRDGMVLGEGEYV